MIKKFLKSIWFPILIFTIFEIILFAIGSYLLIEVNCAQCKPCFTLPEACPPCPCTTLNIIGIIGTIPSLILSTMIYFQLKKHSK